jgi:hypothetical protein
MRYPRPAGNGRLSLPLRAVVEFSAENWYRFKSLLNSNNPDY